jgi:hypothetical protein
VCVCGPVCALALFGAVINIWASGAALFGFLVAVCAASRGLWYEKVLCEFLADGFVSMLVHFAAF